MQELLSVKTDPVQATEIHESSARQKQIYSPRSRTVPSNVGYLDSGEVTWLENPDSAASMFSPSLSVWEETFMDLGSVCATKSTGDMSGDTKHTSSAVADDELNTPIIGNEFSFNPYGVVSRDVTSQASCLNFGNVSDSWENLYVSPSSVTNTREEGTQKEPSSASDMYLIPLQDNSVTFPHQDESMALEILDITDTTQLFGCTVVPTTSIQSKSAVNSSVTNIKSRTENKPGVVKSLKPNTKSVTSVPATVDVPASKTEVITISSEAENIPRQVLHHTEGVKSFTRPSKMDVTAEKDVKRKELKLNLAPQFNIDDISTPVVFDALDADGNINLMEFIDNDNYNLSSPSSGFDAIQYIIAQAEQEAQKEPVTAAEIPSTVLHVDAPSSHSSSEVNIPVKLEPSTSFKVIEDETENVEVWEVKEEHETPQIGLKLKILKQKTKESKIKNVAPKRIKGKRASTRMSSASNKGDDYYEDDDDEEYLPTKRSRTTRRRRLTSASSTSSIAGSSGTSRSRSSVSHVGDIEERYRELRDKNNEASRRSRLNRKAREVEMQEQMVKLQQENQTLRIRSEELEKLVTKLRESLVEIVKNPRH